MSAGHKLIVALAGQPNVGKSTVFNVLTGLSQHVGNWPGKTVEKKEGVHVYDNMEIRLVDLPGTYGLTAFSEEEKIARDFVINEQPDVLVLITNAAALERSLYLLSELLLLNLPVILAVNMMDVAEDQGIHIDINNLQNCLGIPVVSMVASKNKGIKELVSQIILLSDEKLKYNPKIPDISRDHSAIFSNLIELTREHIPAPYTVRWVVTKLMEGDPEISRIMEDILPGDKWRRIQSLLIKHEDSLRAVVGGRYDWIETVTRASVSHFKRGQVLITDRLDHVLTRPVFGIPVLLSVLAIAFLLTYGIGSPVQGLLEGLTNSFARWAEPFSPGLHDGSAEL